MSDFTSPQDSDGESGRTLVIHLQNLVVAEESSTADLAQACRWLWDGRLFIAAVTVIVALASVCYVLIAQSWYRAQTVLVPAEQPSLPGGLAGSLGALGGLVGFNNLRMGGGGAVESIAMLTSAEFTAEFIEANSLMQVLFADDWDAVTGRWSKDIAGQYPDLRDGVKFFDERVRTVREDKKTGLVTLVIEWKDPAMAATWANLLIERLNAKVRDRVLAESDANVKYLKQELADTNIVLLQEAVARLLDSEMQKAMVARVRKDAAFRVLDRAQTPKFRAHPKRVQVVAIATAIALLLSSLGVLMWSAIRRQGRVRGRVVAGS